MMDEKVLKLEALKVAVELGHKNNCADPHTILRRADDIYKFLAGEWRAPRQDKKE